MKITKYNKFRNISVNKLRKLRKDSKMSQQELAEKLQLEGIDLTSKEISKIENVVPALDIEASAEDNRTVNEELETALDKIFGEGDFDERYPEEEIPKASTDTSGKEIIVEEAEDAVDEEEVKKYNRETEKLPTLYIHRTLRSGQSLSSEGNVVVIGDVNPGAEIVAKGDITVWGVLGGIAHAGSDGNTYSRIRALKLNAIQLRIGDIFARRPDTGNMPYVQKSDTFTPEEARVSKKHIVIYRIHES